MEVTIKITFRPLILGYLNKLQLIIEAPLVGELAPLAPEGFAPYCIFSI